MGEKIDIAVLELLASKICHDLISPVGAVANGVEFLEELEIEGGEDIVGLIQFSAKQGSAKLQAYRQAYGAGGSDASIKPEDIHKMFGQFIALDEKITQDWDPYADLGYGDDRPDAYCKMLMCGLLLATECLPKGGAVTVTSEKAGETLIKASGENCTIKPDSARALANDIEAINLEPKQMHAYATRLLARHYGYKVEADQDVDAVIVRITF